jgi:hypothetical protein
MPGISPLRSLPSRCAAALSRLARTFGGRAERPPASRAGRRTPIRRSGSGALAGASGRSIFGARLRSRVPQYGHSVMYGLTSAWQFLQTTKRSGDDISRF